MPQVRDNTAVHLLFLAFVGGAIMFPFLGQEKHFDNREARHAAIAREMIETGEYVVPRVLGKPYIDKPPLFHWAVVAVYRITDRIDVWSARIPSALAAIAAALAVYLLGRRWQGSRAGLWSALVWLTFSLVIEWGHVARMDMLMTSVNLYAIVAAAWSAAARTRGAMFRRWCVSCVLSAAAIMAKGPAPLFFFAVAVIAVWRAERRRWVPPAGMICLWAGVLAAAVVSWFALCELEHPGHVGELFGYQFGTGVSQHAKRIYLYVEQVLLRTAPWGLFALGAVYGAVRRARRAGYDRALIPAVFCAVAFVGLTVLPNKREHYALPALPMWALFVGMFLDQAAGPRDSGGKFHVGESAEFGPRWLFTWPLVVSLAGLAVAPAAVPVVLWSRAPSRSLAVALAVLCAAVAGAATWGLVATLRQRFAAGINALVFVAVLIAAASVPVMTHFVWGADPAVAVARDIAGRVPAGAHLAAYQIPTLTSFENLFFTLARRVLFVRDREELRTFLAGPGRRYVIVADDQAADVGRLCDRSLHETGAWPIDEATNKRIMLLVTSEH